MMKYTTLLLTILTTVLSTVTIDAKSSFLFGVVSTSKIQNRNTAINTSDRYGSKSLLAELRGGAVIECETLEDVNQAISDAALNGKLIVIDFTATWCGPCQMIAPVFKEMSEKIENVVFLKVDVDKNAEAAAQYGVSAMPTFVFVKQGEIVDRLMGANAAKLMEMVEELA
uniref:Thioredoxin domain-containing protein n=1 Tax=Leptocylindrus danicus TaxID=163516 RepID=A0A7S2K245_9STRA